ncbi:extracellular catalytic domain type 1 short-chain-length polyhydroxyalkanoate depolymerase [Ancylobacter terrae]|uniref:extracellular catalytic domain type 1 short-chain-length polyhydroxyalkanoate depolymerase n=1 Tax=Ancylobacter sp. sgz301288 TaxID=3342077 RepID=UPI00385F9462
MRKMPDTMARLAALRTRQGDQGPGSVSPGRLSTLADFGTNPGNLKARCYRPSDLPDGAPLVVVLHGCTQAAAGYDRHAGWSRLADEAGFALLYPEQHHGNNSHLCFNWFQPGDIRRDSGEALSIRQMIEAMVVAHGLDRNRIFITGLSAGGAMTSVMLATYPEVFAGGAIIAGLAYGRAATVPEAFECMSGRGRVPDTALWQLLRAASHHSGRWPRVTIWQGTADQTVVPSNADDIVTQWRSVHQVDAAPTVSEVRGSRTIRTWCNATGDAVIELNTVAGLGHGTPIGDELGVPGPYMLDVGISSTREIVRFWGIADPRDVAAAPQPYPAARDAPAISMPPAAGPDGPMTSRPGQRGPDDGPSPILAGHRASGVRKIIEDALRAAGLMP